MNKVYYVAPSPLRVTNQNAKCDSQGDVSKSFEGSHRDRERPRITFSAILLHHLLFIIHKQK